MNRRRKIDKNRVVTRIGIGPCPACDLSLSFWAHPNGIIDTTHSWKDKGSCVYNKSYSALETEVILAKFGYYF